MADTALELPAARIVAVKTAPRRTHGPSARPVGVFKASVQFVPPATALWREHPVAGEEDDSGQIPRDKTATPHSERACAQTKQCDIEHGARSHLARMWQGRID